MLMPCLCRFLFHPLLLSSSSFLFFFPLLLSAPSFSFFFQLSLFLFFFQLFFHLLLFIFFSFIFLFSSFIYQSSVFHDVLIYLYKSSIWGVCLHCSPYPSFLCLRAVIDENLRFRGKKSCCRGVKESVSPLLSICGV